MFAKPVVEGKPCIDELKLGVPPGINTLGMALEKSSQLDCPKQGTEREQVAMAKNSIFKCFMFLFLFQEVDSFQCRRELTHLWTANEVELLSNKCRIDREETSANRF